LKDYANQRDELPALKVGDEVKAFLLLDGNGAELKTFKTVLIYLFNGRNHHNFGF